MSFASRPPNLPTSPSEYEKEKIKQQRGERTESPIYTLKGFNKRTVREPRCGTNTSGKGIMRMSPQSGQQLNNERIGYGVTKSLNLDQLLLHSEKIGCTITRRHMLLSPLSL